MLAYNLSTQLQVLTRSVGNSLDGMLVYKVKPKNFVRLNTVGAVSTHDKILKMLLRALKL